MHERLLRHDRLHKRLLRHRGSVLKLHVRLRRGFGGLWTPRYGVYIGWQIVSVEQVEFVFECGFWNKHADLVRMRAVVAHGNVKVRPLSTERNLS